MNRMSQDTSGILASKGTQVQTISFQMSLLGYKLLGKNWEPAEICLVLVHSDKNKINLCCGALGNTRIEQPYSGSKIQRKLTGS